MGNREVIDDKTVLEIEAYVKKTEKFKEFKKTQFRLLEHSSNFSKKKCFNGLMSIINLALVDYHKYHCSTLSSWYDILCKEDREFLAELLMDQIVEEFIEYFYGQIS